MGKRSRIFPSFTVIKQEQKCYNVRQGAAAEAIQFCPQVRLPENRGRENGGWGTGKGISMEFWKMNGTGNDFIIIDNMVACLPRERFSEIAATLCNRHMSIGADGLIVVDAPAGKADFRMHFFNGDGSPAEMCGNGARCVCRYGYERGLAGTRQTVETAAGIITGERMEERIYKIRLNEPTEIQLDKTVDVGGKVYPCDYVELGNPGVPHAVVLLPGLRERSHEDLFKLGKEVRYYKDFPKGANANFYEILGEDRVLIKTYERGVEDFTYACGTGTASTVLALTMKGKCSGKSVKGEMAGGELIVDVLHGEDGLYHLYLTGSTNIVAKGTVTDEDLIL